MFGDFFILGLRSVALDPENEKDLLLHLHHLTQIFIELNSTSRQQLALL